MAAVKEELVFTIHALHETGAESKDVPARLFHRKVGQVLKALEKADAVITPEARHSYTISTLRTGSSAVVGITEQARAEAPPRASSVVAFLNVADAVYRSNFAEAERYDGVAQRLLKICDDAGADFSFIDFETKPGSRTVRADTFLRDQVSQFVAFTREKKPEPQPQSFKGVSYDSFDGEVKEVDLRGKTPRAKLVLTDAKKEIDCVFIDFDIDGIRAVLDSRVWAEGNAIYDGTSFLPKRLEITKATPIRRNVDMTKWRGSLSPIDSDDGWGLESDIN